MEKKATPTLPQDVKRAHTKMIECFEGKKDLTGTELDMRDFNRIIAKMPFKTRDNVDATISTVFKMAMDRMESDKDKEVLKGLRQLVREVEDACL